jgi:hypothetical protein
MPKPVNKEDTKPDSGPAQETGLSDTQLDKAAGGIRKGGSMIAADFDFKEKARSDVAIETIEIAHEGIDLE